MTAAVRQVAARRGIPKSRRRLCASSAIGDMPWGLLFPPWRIPRPAGRTTQRAFRPQ